MPYTTALTSLEDSRVLPIDQNCARFWGRIASRRRTMAASRWRSDEGDRIAAALGDKPVLFLKNHGVIVTGRSVAHAFDELYYLEQACRQLVHGLLDRPATATDLGQSRCASVAGDWARLRRLRRCSLRRAQGTARRRRSQLRLVSDAVMPKGYWIARVDVHDPGGLPRLPRGQRGGVPKSTARASWSAVGPVAHGRGHRARSATWSWSSRATSDAARLLPLARIPAGQGAPDGGVGGRHPGSRRI